MTAKAWEAQLTCSNSLVYRVPMSLIPVSYSDQFTTDYSTMDCECPDRITEIYYLIRDLAQFLEPEPCHISDLLLCHSEKLIESVRRRADVYDVARRAVSGAAMAAETALERPAFALVRPPGHHAGHNFNGGFCFFNNIAIAMTKLLKEGRIRHGLIIDIDLHYGNGTYDIVSDESRIVFKNIDAPTRDEFFEDLMEALAGAADYDILGCSAGFDTYIKDWGSLLTTSDFREVGRLITAANKRSFSVLEGGYYIPDLGTNVRSYLEGLREACS